MNKLVYYYIFSQLTLFIAIFFSSRLIASNLDTGFAYLVHFFSIFFFFLGYVFNQFSNYSKKIIVKTPSVTVSKSYFIYSYFLIFFGLFITILQVSLTINPLVYLFNLFFGGFDQNIREAFLLPSSQGGLSGILKMFQTVPLGIYLQSFGIFHFYKLDSLTKSKFKRLILVALISLGVKLLFSLDRITIIGVLFSGLFVLIQNRKLFKFQNTLFVVIILFISNFLSESRLLNFNSFDFFILYSNLSIINLQNMLNSLSGFTFGFSTFLQPLLFITRTFDLSLFDINSTYDWSWNPAQYIVSYAYQDFGYFLFLFFFILGYFINIIDKYALLKRKIFFVLIYFIILYALITFISVPIIRSVEFWLMIFISFFFSNFIAYKKKSYCE